MKLGILTLLCLFCSVGAYAQSIFTVDGITYHIWNSNEPDVYVDKLENGTYSGDLVIPSTVEYNSKKYIVRGVFMGAFSRNTEIRSVKLPSTATNIYFSAFADCPNLTSVELPEGVETIHSETFKNCTSLTTLKLPSTVKVLEDNAFAYCSNLVSIEFPDSLRSIGEYCFQFCKNLATINLPKSLTSVGNSAFFGCSGVKTFTVPSHDISVGFFAFHLLTDVNTFIVKNIDLANKCNLFIPKGNMENYNVEISSPDMFSISDFGYITFKKPGTATITVTGKDDKGVYHKNVCNVVVLGYPVTIGSTGYATFSGISDYVVPNELKAGIVEINKDRANVSYLQPNALGLPAEEAVILKGEPGDYFLNIPEDETTVEKNSNNLLKAVYTNDKIYAAPGNSLFVLSNGNNGLGFYYQMGSNNGTFVKDLRGKAYLDIQTSTLMGLNSLRLFDESVTGIDEVETENGGNATVVYSLSGVRMNQSVDQLPKGVYIVNGKKVMVK